MTTNYPMVRFNIVRIICVGLFLACTISCKPKKSLKTVFKDDFLIGAALGDEAILQKYPNDIKNVRKNFNSISTAMLEWKSINPQPGIFNFDYGDRFVEFGQQNKMFTIGHGLVWHQLVPEWVFLEGGKTASRDVLLKRLHDHIFTVAGRYKGRMGAWIVVNEAFNTDGTLRKSKWLEIIGDDYIQKAFEYAREADPTAKLYYNDFGLFTMQKRAAMIRLFRNLKAKGVVIDGIGIQGHWTLDYPLLGDVEESIYAFEKLGVKLMITEMDISVLPRRNSGAEITDSFKKGLGLDPYVGSLPDSVNQILADRYAQIFAMLHKHRNTFEGVSFWGLNDRDSWRNNWPIKGRTDYPMLFDRDNKPKKAYQAVANIIESTRKNEGWIKKIVRDTFYLDPANGRVDASGKSPESPLKAFPASAMGRPGTTILYKRGSVVRGDFTVFSGTPSAPVTVGAYGSGNKPTFMKSITLDSAQYWVHEGGNLWKCLKDLKSTPCANIVYNEGEFCGAMRWRKQDLNKQGDWYMIDTVGSKFRFQDALYVYSVGNPAVVSESIEYVPSGNFRSFTEKDSNMVIQDLIIKNAGTHGLWFKGAHDISVERCDLSYIGGAVFTGRIGKNGLWVRYGNAVEIWTSGRNINISQCKISESYDAGFVAQGSCGEGCIDSVTVRNNIFWNNGFDNFDNSWGKSISRIYFENNTCINAGDGWAFETEGRPRLSEFLPDTVGWHIFLDSDELDKSTIWIRNNIFYNATDNKLMKVNRMPVGGWPNINIDYNCYFQKDPKTPIIQILKKNYLSRDFKQYVSDTGKDLHSIAVDPLFVDAENGDYRLKRGSPCIDAGVLTGYRVDFSGINVPLGKRQDIGAFEQ